MATGLPQALTPTIALTSRVSRSASDNVKRQQLTASPQREETSHLHSSSMQREADERSEDEEQERAASGHARDVDSEDAVDRIDARLRHRAAPPDAVGGRADDRRGIAVSGAAADARQGMGG